MQLAHAGRKSSTYAPWVHSNIAKTFKAPTYVAGKDEGGWPDDGERPMQRTWSVPTQPLAVPGPSDIPFSDLYPKPNPMTEEDMQRVEDAFVQAVERCKRVGCQSSSLSLTSANGEP